MWVVGPLMYAGATAVGLSRMYHNKHWASDVVIGAAIGTFSGRKVVQYAHGHPGNLIDRVILRTSVVPDGNGGVALAFSFPDVRHDASATAEPSAHPANTSVAQ